MWLVRWGRGCGVGGGAGAACVFLGGELQSMCLELLPCAGEIIRGGFERSDGGAFGNRGGVGLQLVGKQCDEGRVECACLCGFVGDSVAGFGVEGLSDSVQIETLIANLLKEMGRENGLGNTPRGNEPAKLAVTERPGGKICSPMVRK